MTELCEDEGCGHHGTPHICFSGIKGVIEDALDKAFEIGRDYQANYVAENLSSELKLKAELKELVKATTDLLEKITCTPIQNS